MASPREAAVAIVHHVNSRDQYVAILALTVLSPNYVAHLKVLVTRYMCQKLWVSISSSNCNKGFLKRICSSFSRTTSSPSFPRTTTDSRNDRGMACYDRCL